MAPDPPKQTIDYDRIAQEVIKRLPEQKTPTIDYDKLVEMLAAKLPQPMKGEPGPQGPPGPPGPPASNEQLQSLMAQIQQLSSDLATLQTKLAALGVKVDNLPKGGSGDTPIPAPQRQVIYLTARNHPECQETDAKIARLRELGYDYIRTVVLSTTEVSVSDVPRLVVFPGKKVVQGKNNVLVYLTQLVR